MSLNLTQATDVSAALQRNPAVRMLRKDQAGLIVAFLYTAFRDRRQSAYTGSELTSFLSDFLFAANDGQPLYPRPARDYLQQWTDEGFLRQYYEDRSDEATFELTPAGEQALNWVASMNQREFVGAESRLRQVFDQLRELSEATTVDKEERRRQLMERRDEIDRRLQALEEDELDRLDDTRIRERYFLIEETATKLESDFRQIEANFRQINARAREDLIGHDTGRGEALKKIFDSRDAILDTDQGRTFTAFWFFLMDQDRRTALRGFLDQIFEQPELAGLRSNSFLNRMEYALVEAGNRVNKTTDRLIEQLRRFLQSRAYLENRRITQLITEIEQLAVAVKNEPPAGRRFTTVEGAADVSLIMDRGVFQPPEQLRLPEGPPPPGSFEQVETDALYDILYVDPAELKGQLNVLLRDRDQISLLEVVQRMPPRRGLSELIAYFGIATSWEEERRAVISPDRRQTIPYEKNGERRTVDFPETIFLA